MFSRDNATKRTCLSKLNYRNLQRLHHIFVLQFDWNKMEISKITSPREWKYFAKGNANILFRYEGANDYLKHKLLRLRLKKDDDKYISTCELYDFIELKCKRLFLDQIIDVQLVVLTPEFTADLDTSRHELMISEQYGLLIPNILCGNYSKVALSKYCNLYVGDADNRNNESAIDSVIIEMKPKWLYDNQTNYCRTCLLNQLKGYERHFCPLDFLYEETISSGLEDLFSKIPPHLLESIEVRSKIALRELMKRFVTNPNNVFRKLKNYQEIENENDLIMNLKSQDDVLERLSLIMTLRDVGLFIKFEKFDKTNNFHTSHNNINNIVKIDGRGTFLLTSFIYDLDLKSKMRYKHWIEVEDHLQKVYNSSNPDWRFCVKRENLLKDGLQ